MKGSSLYGKINLNEGGQANRPDGRAKSSAFQKDEVVQGGVKPTVNVSGGKKTTFDDRNRVMTKEELLKAKINPQPGTTYYKNKKTGRVSTATKAE